MGTSLRIVEVRLDDTEVPHVWKFPLGVTVIVGDVGGGKTSLLNLINYGLGGDSTLTAEVRDAARGVTLDVQAGERRLQISRTFGAPFVTVTHADGEQNRLALTRGAKDPWLSDLLLQSLGIPQVRVRQSRTGRSHRLTSISFLDVLAYCYLDQEQVDRSTVYDNDRYRGPKRLWTFELLYGLIDEAVAATEAEIEELREAIDSRQKRVKSVEQFVTEKGLLRSQAEARIEQIESQQRGLERALSDARTAADAAAREAANGREESERIDRALSFARAERARIRKELAGVVRAANQLERDIAAQEEGLAAAEALDRLPFLVCPRCEQSLTEREHDPARCVVCLQPEPPANGAGGEAELRRLHGQLAETRRLEAELRDAERALHADVNRLAADLKRRQLRIQQAVERATAPHRSQAALIQETLGALRGEKTALSEVKRVDQVVDDERQELESMGPMLARLEQRAALERAQLAEARERVDELSEAFEEILRLFTLPWLQTAEVDRETYLPRVNGRSLRELSSGGMKATTNVAYYMAILVTALRDRQVLTPRFLMLDSIRKDYGGGEKDLARAERIYEYLRTLQDMQHTPGALAADFQLIVVDNDLPEAFEKAFHTIPIDPDRPLIRTG